MKHDRMIVFCCGFHYNSQQGENFNRFWPILHGSPSPGSISADVVISNTGGRQGCTMFMNRPPGTSMPVMQRMMTASCPKAEPNFGSTRHAQGQQPTN